MRFGAGKVLACVAISVEKVPAGLNDARAVGGAPIVRLYRSGAEPRRLSGC